MMEGTAYVHSSSPKALASKMKKTAVYRDDDEENLMSSNIMHVRRRRRWRRGLSQCCSVEATKSRT